MGISLLSKVGSDMLETKGISIQSPYELFGCIPRNYTVLIEGEPGSGKTSLAIAFAYNYAYACRGRVLYITTNVRKSKITKYG